MEDKQSIAKYNRSIKKDKQSTKKDKCSIKRDKKNTMKDKEKTKKIKKATKKRYTSKDRRSNRCPSYNGSIRIQDLLKKFVEKFSVICYKFR